MGSYSHHMGPERKQQAMKTYMSLTEIARMLKISTGALANYQLPPADALIGRTRGWKRATIEQWDAHRPGHGGRPKKKQ